MVETDDGICVICNHYVNGYCRYHQEDIDEIIMNCDDFVDINEIEE